MTEPKLAVIVTTFNRRAMTLRSLETLFGQQLANPLTIDVYLADASSTDGTVDAVKTRFPSVHCMQVPSDMYWTRGMHRALSVAAGGDYDYYWWLNDDTMLREDALRRLMSTSKELSERGHPQAIVVGSLCDACTGEVTYGGLVRRSKLNRVDFIRIEPRDFPLEVDTMNGNCVLIPRSVLASVGNLDTVFNHYLGDYDYGLRAREKGFSIWVTPGFVGTCSRNPVVYPWRTDGQSIRDRWRLVLGPKGAPPKACLVYARRHAGLLWPFVWSRPYVGGLLPTLRLAIAALTRRL
jgi:GT2 family glycosyltransferase